MHRSAAIDGNRRWSLHRVWDETKPLLLVIMHNPSIANADREDPTMLRVIHFAKLWGFGGAVVVNLFPWITPDKRLAIGWAKEALAVPGHVFNPYLRDDLHAGLTKAVAAAERCSAILCAWGNIEPCFDEWADHVREAIECAPRPLDGPNSRPVYCLGLTGSNDPKHPLARGRHRVSNDQQPIPYPTFAPRDVP